MSAAKAFATIGPTAALAATVIPRRGITSDVWVIPMQRVNQTCERMLKSDVKHRFSIDVVSLKD